MVQIIFFSFFSSRLWDNCSLFKRFVDVYLEKGANVTSRRQKHFLGQIRYETEVCLDNLQYKAYLLAPISFKSGLQTYYYKLYSEPAANGYDVHRSSELNSLYRSMYRMPQLLKVGL